MSTIPTYCDCCSRRIRHTHTNYFYKRIWERLK